MNLYILNNISLSNSAHNCNYENIDNVYKELYKRFLIPLYIPVLFLTTLILILSSKENKNYSSRKVIIFLFNFFLIVFSEVSLKFINKSVFENYLIFSIPIILMFFLLLNFNYQFKFRHNNVILK
jgi:lipopolysaccharide export system permease protein